MTLNDLEPPKKVFSEFYCLRYFDCVNKRQFHLSDCSM